MQKEALERLVEEGYNKKKATKLALGYYKFV